MDAASKFLCSCTHTHRGRRNQLARIYLFYFLCKDRRSSAVRSTILTWEMPLSVTESAFKVTMRIRRKTQRSVRSWMRFRLSGTMQSWLQSLRYIPTHMQSLRPLQYRIGIAYCTILQIQSYSFQPCSLHTFHIVCHSLKENRRTGRTRFTNCR